MSAQLTGGAFDGHVDLARRHLEAFGHLLEVVDQRFHGLTHDVLDVLVRVALAIGAHRQIARPFEVGILYPEGLALAFDQLVAHLLEDAQRLHHLVAADLEASIGIAAGLGADIEVVVVVAQIRLGLAQIPGVAGRPQHRAGHAEHHAGAQIQHADVLSAGLEDRVVEHEQRDLGDVDPQLLDQLVQQVDAVVRHVVLDAARPDVGVVHAQTGQRLGELEDAFPLAQADLLR